MRVSDLTVDVKRQEEGEWRDHPYYDGVRVLVRSIHSKPYRERQRQLMNRLKSRRRKLGDAVHEQLEVDRHAAGDLLGGWEGIEDEKGKPFEFSVERSREWAKDDRYRRFFDGILELAQEIGEGETAAQEEALQD